MPSRRDPAARVRATVRRPPEGTAASDEIRRFSALAEAWWDPAGDFRALHKFNPVRIAFVRDRLSAHFGRDPSGDKPLDGFELLDIGCGGGLVSEPMCRLGARVTAIDASERNVNVAAAHAADGGLKIAYRCVLPETLARQGASFDVVLNMEVVEHVADLAAFLDASASLVRPGGAMVVATLNRTLKALALAKIGAEYVLHWLPAGTHDWRKFVRPSELVRGLRRNGMTVVELKGMGYDPFRDRWSLTPDLDVNYLAFAVKP